MEIKETVHQLDGPLLSHPPDSWSGIAVIFKFGFIIFSFKNILSMVSGIFLTFYHSDTDSPASLFRFPFKDTCDYIKSISHSVVSDSVTPWTVAHQAPLSMGFCRVIPFSRGSSPPRDQTQISHIAGIFFTV